MILNDIILNHQEMITTSIREPQDGDLAFFGKTCVAALVFKPNHWITYVKKSHIWWCLDSMLNASFQQNPFDHQSNELTIMQLWFL